MGGLVTRPSTPSVAAEKPEERSCTCGGAGSKVSSNRQIGLFQESRDATLARFNIWVISREHQIMAANLPRPQRLATVQYGAIGYIISAASYVTLSAARITHWRRTITIRMDFSK
ncbi:hypothetical protein B0J13DRAFT_604495 [Dactylonectria estremocensis]|uniref:Uncharacterized protein n=1 Tax=Dactylonectria estremocensis TaxID=1079267 RepID=A0A9P9F7F4_9HYPO|nr:hypothetical protein B0J13DRAFT_604495 [Dactylonectria estremocensis]